MSDVTEQLAEDVREALTGLTKRDEQVQAIVEFIMDRERENFAWEVYPLKTHAEIEHVEAYGLEIGVDANGHACRVTFPDGAMFDE